MVARLHLLADAEAGRHGRDDHQMHRAHAPFVLQLLQCLVYSTPEQLEVGGVANDAMGEFMVLSPRKSERDSGTFNIGDVAAAGWRPESALVLSAT